jgi:hypothetical protein
MAKDMTMLCVVRPTGIEVQVYGAYPHPEIEAHLKAGARIVRNVFSHPDIEIEVMRYRFTNPTAWSMAMNNVVMNTLQDYNMPVKALRRVHYDARNRK